MKSKIFIINLAHAQERRQAALHQLEKWLPQVECVSAADAEALPQTVLDQYYSLEGNQKCYHKILKNCEKGCYLSHIWCWQKIVNERLDFAIILEDDFILKGDLSLLLRELHALPPDWHYLKLTASSACRTRSIISQQPLQFFTLVNYSKNPTVALAQAISYNGAQLLLDALPFKRPVDVDLQYPWEIGIKAQGLLPYCFEVNSQLPSQMKERDTTRSHFPRRLKLAVCHWYRNSLHNVKTYGITATVKAQKQ